MSNLAAVIERYFNHADRCITLPLGQFCLPKMVITIGFTIYEVATFLAILRKKVSGALKFFLPLPAHLLGYTVFSLACGRRHPL